jgi:hypothetical protein
MEAPKAKRTRAKKTAAAASDVADTASTPSVLSAFGATPAIFIEEIEKPAPVPSPKKKSTARKPTVVATVTPDGIQGSLAPEKELRPLIVHLPIQSSDIDSEMFAQTPAAPVDGGGRLLPYDPDMQVAGFNQDQQNIIICDPVATASVPLPAVAATRPTLPLHYSEKLMVHFQDANREQHIPDATDVACFWDCHQFRGKPCVIPTVIEEGIWRVYGNFCSPECAAAYLFNERLDLHVQWERYALLNRLYAQDGDPVRLAPARTALQMFGGTLDISDYRKIMAEKRMRIDVMTPPMISIIQVMDTKPIDFYDASMKNNFIPWEMDRMNRPGAQGLRLRRSKPVAEKESTLEYCMGISV